MDDIRHLPAQDTRVETGAIAFGDDWPGTFIRGDHCFHYALMLEAFLAGHTDPITTAGVRGLLDALRGSNLITRMYRQAQALSDPP